MDKTEKFVADHLAHRGFTDVVYEPDGNVPPDFLVNRTIAIEVRRLNQNYFDGADVEGLEEVAIPLRDRMRQLMDSLGPPTGRESWYVTFVINRPLEKWKTLEPKLRHALETFSDSPLKRNGKIAKLGGIELSVDRTPTAHPKMFVMGGFVDRQAGGFVIAEMAKNIRYCVLEKSRKIGAVRTKYPVWWLALVDHVGYGLGKLDQDMFRNQVSIEHTWDKLILIDPQDHSRWFEI